MKKQYKINNLTARIITTHAVMANSVKNKNKNKKKERETFSTKKTPVYCRICDKVHAGLLNCPIVYWFDRLSVCCKTSLLVAKAAFIYCTLFFFKFVSVAFVVVVPVLLWKMKKITVAFYLHYDSFACCWCCLFSILIVQVKM